MKGKLVTETDLDENVMRAINSELGKENTLELPECKDCGDKYANCGDYCMVGMA